MELNMGTEYHLAKQGFASGAVSQLDKTKTVSEMANIGAWMAIEPTNQYFMLLCREAYDFTVINMLSHNYNKAIQELTEILESRGKIIYIEYCHDDENYEIWIKTNEMMKQVTGGEDYVMFKLFPCNEWVIEV